MGVVHFKLPQVDGSSIFMSQVNLDSLETINSKEILKAHLTGYKRRLSRYKSLLEMLLIHYQFQGTKLSTLWSLRDRLTL